MWWICATALVCVVVASLATWRVIVAANERIWLCSPPTPEQRAVLDAAARRVRAANLALDRKALLDERPWWVGHWRQQCPYPTSITIAPSGEFVAVKPSCEVEERACGRVLSATLDHVQLEFTVPWDERAHAVTRELRRIRVDDADALLSESRWRFAQSQPDPDRWFGPALVRRLPEPKPAPPKPYELVPGVWVDESADAPVKR